MDSTAPASTAGAGGTRLLTLRFFSITLATLAYFTACGALLPTLPKYVKDELGGSGVAVGVSVGVFSIAAAILRPWAGRLGDRKGRRVLVVGGAAIVGASIMAYGVIANVPALIALRTLSGVGEAAVFVGFATAVQDMSPDDRRGEAASYYSVALYAGLAIGPTIGERMANAHGYDATWLIAGALALLAALLGWRTPVGEPSDRNPETVLHRAALGPGIVLFLGLIPYACYAAFLSIYADKIGIEHVGPIFATYAGCIIAVRMLGARLPDRLGWRLASVIALCSSILAGVLLASWPSTLGMYVSTVAMSIGQSFLFPALFTAVVHSADESERSHAVGTFSVFFDLSNGVGAPVLGVVVSLWNERGAFAVASVVGATGFIALRGLHARTVNQPPPTRRV
jgi:MFS family permease